MKILKRLFLGLLAIVALLVVISLFLPSSAHVERSITIAAPQNTVFTLLNGFARMNDWSPWAELDPNTSYTYEGPDQGVGARMAWQSDHPQVGNGSQQITGSDSPQRVESHLDFGPQGTAEAFFDLSEGEGGTQVVWGFDTQFGFNPIGRYFGLKMDSMLGPSYEKGLANLKELAESLPQADFSDLTAETTETESMPIAFVSATTSQEPADIQQAFTDAYGQVGAFIAKNSLSPSGPPIAINTSWDENGYAFDAAMPIAAAPEGDIPEDSTVQVGQTYAGKVLKVVHQGSYTEMEATYGKIEAYVAARGWKAADRPWDEWVSDPSQTPEAELITNIYFPID